LLRLGFHLVQVINRIFHLLLGFGQVVLLAVLVAASLLPLIRGREGITIPVATAEGDGDFDLDT
jgi:hypothetical protein